MTNDAPDLRCGPWRWRSWPSADRGRAGFADVQLWHDELPLPVLDVTGGAWALAAPSFAADGAQLQFDVVTLANKARFRVTVDLAAGCWRSPGELRGLPMAVLQQRYGSSNAIAAWPVVPPAPLVPPAPVVPVHEVEREAAPANDEVARGHEHVAVSSPMPSATRASEPETRAGEVLPPPAVTPDGRWRFEFAWAPVHEQDASGRRRSYCHFVLHDADAAAAFDSRTTGDLCWPAGRWLRLVRGPGAATYFVVDIEKGVFWLENFREPLGPERPLAELAATLRRG